MTRIEKIILATLCLLLATGVAVRRWRRPVLQEWTVVSPPPPSDSSRRGLGRKLDLNQATLQDLEELPGIGPSLARGILEFRESRGPFRRVEDLRQVPGVGPKRLQRLAPLLKVR